MENMIEINNWIDEKSKEYKGKKRFYRSEEYRNAYKHIHQVWNDEHEKREKYVSELVKELNLKSGDCVSYQAASEIFGMRLIHGTLFMKSRIPHVRLSEPVMISGIGYRKTIPWNKEWRKE